MNEKEMTGPRTPDFTEPAGYETGAEVPYDELAELELLSASLVREGSFDLDDEK